MNIKKLSSFLFQRSVIVAVLIILQATVLLVPMRIFPITKKVRFVITLRVAYLV